MYHCNARLGGLRKKLCYESLKASSWLPAVFAVGLVLATTAQEAPAKAAKPEPFKLTNIHFETNETACDMGIQIAFDTEGVTELSVKGPNGQIIYSTQSTAGMADIGGQTEGFLEGVEPPVEGIGCQPDPEGVISVEDLFTAFPAGKYEFQGQGGGVTFKGSAVLTHNIPAGPVITAPTDGTVVSADEDLLIEWEKVTDPIIPSLGPIDIVGYHIVVVDVTVPVLPPGKLKIALDGDVSEDETSFLVPAQYLEPNRIYEFEILATDKGGNQTITEGGAVCTAPVAPADCELP
jgi:hypothetical protein